MRFEGIVIFRTIIVSLQILQGKWMYEVTLGTAGIMQLGWATAGCQFSNEEGVGDSVDSYAYDGKRVQRWNISCK